MKSEKVLVHASQALFAMIVLACVVTGCGKQEAKKPLPEVYPSEGHAYMKDPAFKKQLDAQKKEKNAILAERERLFAEFAALEKREGSRAAAMRSPRWQELEKQAQDCLKKFDANRLRTTELFETRAKQAQADSAKIARGEAKAASVPTNPTGRDGCPQPSAFAEQGNDSLSHECGRLGTQPSEARQPKAAAPTESVRK